jgi:predicted nuclease of predicted toxin-antitoxin system
MNSFVFDENFNDRRLVDACNSEGRCTVHRFPEALKSAKDPEVLRVLLANKDTLVTLDGPIIDRHREHVPDNNPGIIIVRQRRTAQTMTTKRGGQLLHQFKANLPEWATLNYELLRIDVTETGAIIASIRDPINRVSLDYGPDFIAAFRDGLDMIRRNDIARHSRLISG